MASPTSAPAQRRTIPAWALSAVTHAAILVLIPLLWTNASSPTAQTVDRRVAIVLANTNGSRVVEYLTEDDAEAQEENQAEVGAEAISPTAALPAAAMAAGLASEELTLPALETGSIAADAGLMQSPRLTVSGRSRIPSGLDPSAIFAEEAARKQAILALGPSTSLGLFGSDQASGRSFVFLIDRSKSMGGAGLGAMSAAEDELVWAVQQLKSNHEFQIIAYHHRCVFLNTKRKMLAATEENKKLIRGYLNGLAAFGATEHMTGLMTALQLEPDAIFMLTDGGDPYLSAGEIARIAKFAKGKTAIHCIQFGSGPRQKEANFLQRLAAYCNGGYGYVDMSQGRR
jgi:hypothetical protein